jgi:hypothetical protein
MLDLLLADEHRRRRMSHNAAQRATHYSLEQTFDNFWADHLAIVEPPMSEQAEGPLAGRPADLIADLIVTS